MIYGTGRFVTRGLKYVIRRTGVASAFLYLGPKDDSGTHSWVEELADAQLFYIDRATRLADELLEDFDESVAPCLVSRAAKEHGDRLETDLSEEDF